MSEPLNQYFAHEAGEFLDQLDSLVASSERPDEIRLFRLARGVRGSAQLAGAGAIAGVAEGLEEGARAIRDGVLAWSPEVRDRVRTSVTELRGLVERHARWTDADDEAARVAAERWSGVGAGRRRADRPGGGDELAAFVAREIAGVAEELGRVLGELGARPGTPEPLRSVLRRMRPVRGLAGLPVLAPVLEVLESVEDVAHRMLGRSGPATAAEQRLLGSAHEALGAAGHSLSSGEVPHDLPALAAFRELRDRDETGTEPVHAVAVSRLFADGDSEPIVSSPMAPFHGSTPAAVEAFVAMEGTGFLDRADGVLAGAASQPRRLARATREASELALGVAELASLYGFASLAAAATSTAASVAAAPSADAARTSLHGLRGELPRPAPGQHGEDEEELPAGRALPEGATAGPERESRGEPVAVDDLLYDPADALREALGLRTRVRALLKERDDEALTRTLDEVFDLVALGSDGRG
jgi:HPt (histidine-containing phosphotransfer) domain-containing protein